MAGYVMTQGDTGPTISGTITGLGDISGAVITLNVEALPATVVVNGTVTDGPSGAYSITFVGTEFDATTVGIYDAKLKTVVGGQTITTPPFDFTVLPKALTP